MRQDGQHPAIRPFHRNAHAGQFTDRRQQGGDQRHRHLGHRDQRADARQLHGAQEQQRPFPGQRVAGRAAQQHGAQPGGGLQHALLDRQPAAARGGEGGRPGLAIRPHQHQVAEGEILEIQLAQHAVGGGRLHLAVAGELAEHRGQPGQHAVDRQEMPVHRAFGDPG